VIALSGSYACVFLLGYPLLDAEKSPRPIAEAAVETAGPTGGIGVFDHAAFEGGLAYYAGRRVTLITNADDAAAFAASGGRALVVARDRFENLGAGWRRVTKLRSGARELWIAAPAAP
jgi:hypothetical protein